MKLNPSLKLFIKYNITFPEYLDSFIQNKINDKVNKEEHSIDDNWVIGNDVNLEDIIF